MTPDDIRVYKTRWALVAEVEREELRRMSVAEKFADLEMLFEAAHAFGGSFHTDEQVEKVRRRWALLAERLGV